MLSTKKAVRSDMRILAEERTTAVRQLLKLTQISLNGQSHSKEN